MNKVTVHQIEVNSQIVETDFGKEYVTTIMFSSKGYPSLNDREMLASLIENQMEIEYRMSLGQSPTEFDKIK